MELFYSKISIICVTGNLTTLLVFLVLFFLPICFCARSIFMLSKLALCLPLLNQFRNSSNLPFFSATASTCSHILVVLFVHDLSQCKPHSCSLVTVNTLFIFVATMHKPSVASGFWIIKAFLASMLLALSSIISRTGKGTDFT